MPPLVSVIIPAHNTEAYIAKAIHSALGQTLHHLEVIVVDDASTDGTVAVVQRIRDDRLTLLINPENRGAAQARNRAIEAATGDWIALLDSDDWYAPDRLAALLAIANDHQADMVADDIFFVAEGDDQPSTTLIERSGTQLTEVSVIDATTYVKTNVRNQRGLTLGLSKPLMRRAFLQRNEIRYIPEVRLGQDFWLYLDCLIKGARYVLVPRPYYYYRLRPGSLVRQSSLQRFEVYRQVANQFLERDAIKQNTPLKEALQHNLKVIERDLAYYRVTEPLQQMHIFASLRAMVCNPSFFLNLFGRLPGILQRRWQYHVRGDRHAFEGRLPS